MCITLGLHRDYNSLPSLSYSGSVAEARYCLFASYIIDKGLAMNLGRPPCLPDDHIEVDLRLVAAPSQPTLRQTLQNCYLELAIAQSGILTIRMAKAKGPSACSTDKIKSVSGILDGAWSMIQDVSVQTCHRRGVKSILTDARCSYQTNIDTNCLATISNTNTEWPSSPTTISAQSSTTCAQKTVTPYHSPADKMQR
jgi:hypothetical protein